MFLALSLYVVYRLTRDLLLDDPVVVEGKVYVSGESRLYGLFWGENLRRRGL